MFRNKLRNFMIGRYGPDQLNVALVITALIISILDGILGLRVLNFRILSAVSYVLLILAILRMMSKNIPARRRENDKFLKFWWPVKQKVRGFFERIKGSKNYRFFKCPGCHNTLRLPKGKGKIQITCPRCGERFIKKT